LHPMIQRIGAVPSGDGATHCLLRRTASKTSAIRSPTAMLSAGNPGILRADGACVCVFVTVAETVRVKMLVYVHVMVPVIVLVVVVVAPTHVAEVPGA
jgi:hypothetical protein